MAENHRSLGSGLTLPFLLLFVLATGAGFAFVPVVECRRCGPEGQFATEMVINGRPAVYIDYCDCGSFFSDKRARISLLRALQRPRSLKLEARGGTWENLWKTR